MFGNLRKSTTFALGNQRLTRCHSQYGGIAQLVRASDS